MAVFGLLFFDVFLILIGVGGHCFPWVDVEVGLDLGGGAHFVNSFIGYDRHECVDAGIGCDCDDLKSVYSIVILDQETSGVVGGRPHTSRTSPDTPRDAPYHQL